VLMPYHGPFDGFHVNSVTVSMTCLVRFDRNKYSVNASAVGRPVDVYAYADRVVLKQDGVVAGEDARRFGRNQTAYDPWHYVAALANKPGARLPRGQAQRCVIGGTGTGKTHIGIGIARSVIRKGRKARFFNAVDLANKLEMEGKLGHAGRTADALTRSTSSS
jgi:hypothetical protein